MKINFYYIEEKFIDFVFRFLTKTLESNKKIIFYSNNEKSIIDLNKALWVHNLTSFLPHLLYNEEGSENVPILLSNTEENKYNCDYLLTSSYINNNDFLNSFQKIYYIVYNNENSINEAKKSWDLYKQQNITLNFCKKENNKYNKVQPNINLI